MEKGLVLLVHNAIDRINFVRGCLLFVSLADSILIQLNIFNSMTLSKQGNSSFPMDVNAR